MQCLGTPISGLLVSLAVWSADAAWYASALPTPAEHRASDKLPSKGDLFVWMSH
jgi:hypothetical protein